MGKRQPNVFFAEALYDKAWEKLSRTTTDAAGVDGVRIHDVSSPQEFIAEIQTKILANTYEPSPIKKIEIKKNGKTRTIGILTLEDRFVHMLVKCWLEPICLPRFHKRSFAYQPGKSANQAIEQLESWLNEGYEWIGETDIRNFFDEIDHQILEQQLRYFVKDQEKIDFILYLYHQQERGIVQGSPLSPLLANIYLHLFDEYMAANEQPYLRFSDDLVILDRTKEAVERRIESMKQFLSMLKLSAHPEKTAVKHISETFEFLGFHFDEEGRKIATKGIESLQEKLKQVDSFPKEERGTKYEQILRGWYQYYETIPWETFENPEWLLFVTDFETDRDTIHQIYTKTIHSLSSETLVAWHIHRLYRMASILEFPKDQLYWLAYLDMLGEPLSVEYQQQIYALFQITKQNWGELCEYLKKCILSPSDEMYDEFIQWLLEKKWFALAKLFHDPTPPLISNQQSKPISSINDEDIFWKFLNIFSGKEDIFLLEQQEQEKRVFVEIYRPLTVEDVKKHYCGEITIAQYIIRSNKTVSYAVIDIDIPKHVLHNIGKEGPMFEEKRKQAFRDALRLYETAQKHGFPSYLVDSGFRGYHIWFFFEEPIVLKTAYEFLAKLTKEAGVPSEGIVWELFPKQRKLKEGAKGQAIKLPWGKHSFTSRQAWFVDENGEMMADQLKMIEIIKSIRKQSVHRFVNGDAPHSQPLSRLSSTVSQSVLTVLHGCSIVRHMVDKAKQTNYLTHQERLLLLNVFAPMGEEGKHFIHHVISHTFNYNPQTTEKFIRRCYSKPISCIRIREHFPNLTAQLSCNCQFPLKKGMYPTPVLHSQEFQGLANTAGADNQTLSDRKSKNEEMTSEKMDHIKYINELVHKMIQLRKHQRGINGKLKEIEAQLDRIFTEMNVDRLEIDHGYLVRKREENGDKWVIEL